MLRSHGLKVLLFGLALAGLGVGSYHHSNTNSPQAPTVVNKTKALEVISILPVDRGYELRLKNISQKSINGYSVAFDDGTDTLTVDRTAGEHVIGPGEEFRMHFAEQRAKRQCVIRAAVFEDGTSDGDAAAVTEITDRRAGALEQLVRIASLLESATSSGDIDRLKARLQELPEDAAPGRSPFVSFGMRDAKQDALLEIDNLNKSDVRAQLTRLAENHNRRVARLTKATNP